MQPHPTSPRPRRARAKLCVNPRQVNNASAEIPAFHLLTHPDDKRESEQEMLELLGQEVDLIVLARYTQILGPEFVAQYLLRMINIHNSFLPAFVGAKPYHQALHAA
jgi:formyltetrahydrofolate hydrolase